MFVPGFLDFDLFSGKWGCALVSFISASLHEGLELLEELGRVSQTLILNLRSRLGHIGFVPSDKVQEGLHTLLVVIVRGQLLELSEQNCHRDDKLWESKRVAVGGEVQSQGLNDFLNNAIAALLGLDMLLGELEGDESVWDEFVLERFGLGVEESHASRVHGVEHVLSGWDELTSLSINLDDQFKELQVEGEVLDVVGEADDANDELD